MFPSHGPTRLCLAACALAISFFCQGCFEGAPPPPSGPPFFRKYDGFIGDHDGNADEVSNLPAMSVTLADAKRRCGGEPSCVGFSFKGDMDEEQQQQQTVHFKSHVVMYNDCWVSYKKGEEFEVHDGFISDDDDNQCSALPTDEKMSLQQAKDQCSGEASCAGFTVRGYTHVELDSANDVKAEVHFKESWSTPHHDCWSSYVKEHWSPPAPPPPPRRTTTPAPSEEEEEAPASAYYAGSEETPAPEEPASAYYGSGPSPAPEPEEEAASAYYR